MEFYRNMAEGLDWLMAKLSFTKKEQSVVAVKKDWIEEMLQEGKNSLMWKVLTKKVVNKEAMKNVFSPIWKFMGDLQMTEVGDKVFIFQFDVWCVKERVLIQQPWYFKNFLVIFMDFDGSHH